MRIGLLAATLLGVAFAAAWSLKDQRPPPAHAALGDRTQCAAYSGLPPGWGQDAHAGMVHLRGGAYELGSTRGYAEERPPQTRRVEPFWIDRTEVSNAQFAAFVAATGYVTEAEKGEGAAVFRAPEGNDATTAEGSWWHLVKGADWRHPEGPGSSIEGRGHEPVVDVSYADALAYAHWLGRELPSETQWEYAAKAGRNNESADRALRDAQGRPLANFWQGLFPYQDTGDDGFPGRAPVGCFPANPFGLHDMVGNVWEWTTDTYAAHGEDEATRGAGEAVSVAPMRSGAERKVIKGGSYLCAANYCVRARAASRQPEEIDLPASHLGFRTVAKS
ncbi:MAG: formylglycine-generating enzyme family protein [Nevskiaceae bacterium]|nr:MAG: formylglycine-generating enzyme family protein [Nevskiaceae bacterium]